MKKILITLACVLLLVGCGDKTSDEKKESSKASKETVKDLYTNDEHIVCKNGDTIYVHELSGLDVVNTYMYVDTSTYSDEEISKTKKSLDDEDYKYTNEDGFLKVDIMPLMKEQFDQIGGYDVAMGMCTSEGNELVVGSGASKKEIMNLQSDADYKEFFSNLATSLYQVSYIGNTYNIYDNKYLFMEDDKIYFFSEVDSLKGKSINSVNDAAQYVNIDDYKYEITSIKKSYSINRSKKEKGKFSIIIETKQGDHKRDFKYSEGDKYLLISYNYTDKVNGYLYYYTSRANATEEAQKHIKKEPSIGMTKQEVLNSTWGEPKDKNVTESAYGTHEQWVYGNGKYIYFDNGVVTTIQR